MALNKNKQKLFDEAFYLYQSIIKFVKSVYIGKESSEKEIQGEVTSLNKSLALTDLYLQGLLLKILESDSSISEDKIIFITQLPENTNMVYEIMPNYKRMLRSINTSTFEAYKEDLIKVTNSVPIFLYLAVSVDKEKKSNMSMYLIRAIEKICISLTDMDDGNKVNELGIISDEVSKLINFLKDNGVFINSKSDKDANAKLEGKESLDELLIELNELVGLKSVKNDVLAMINLIKVNNLRKEKGLKCIPICNHMIFTGSPGTGKTTIARLLAKIYKELGIVSKGHLVETDRSGLVAGYVGQTALKVEAVVKRSIGGVLFIDEAYDLVKEASGNDFGEEAITTLVKMMEDNRDDLIVIAAGYTEKMGKFINANPGLSSRFNKFIHFTDFDTDELLSIFKYTCTKAGILISEAALSSAENVFKLKDNYDFGNARGIRNYFDKAIINQANRVIRIKNVSSLELQTIEKEDLVLIQMQIKESGQSKKIGF